MTQGFGASLELVVEFPPCWTQLCASPTWKKSVDGALVGTIMCTSGAGQQFCHG